MSRTKSGRILHVEHDGSFSITGYTINEGEIPLRAETTIGDCEWCGWVHVIDGEKFHKDDCVLLREQVGK